MFAKQIEPPANNQMQYPFTCSKCKRPSQTAYMCEKCFEETDPTQKQDDLAWYESPKSKPRKGRGRGRIQWLAEQKAKKDAKTFTDLVAEYLAKQSSSFVPGWTERIQEFAQHEIEIQQRQEWLRSNATQLWAVTAWLYWEEEIDRIRISQYKWDEYKNKRIGTVNADVFDIREDKIDHTPVNELDEADFEGLFPEWYQSITLYQRNIYSRYTVFANKVAKLLNAEEFAILQVVVHQKKTNRAARRITACTAEDAAKLLTVHLGRAISAANYPKLIKKLYETLEVEDGIHLDSWIESGIL